MQKTFTVKGMSCQNCVKRVIKIITAAQQTSDVSVDLKTEQAVFNYHPEQTDLQAIISDLAEYDFEVVA
ncbi:MAG: hypothetical protein COB04_06280 [Gammaproteobacteria bacterium]|nr:MAG: hypothetical protein COB04_06280 [Gammaproteobacteria bacterium]